MVSRLKCQFNKHCIRFDNILKIDCQKKKDYWNQKQAHRAGDETELTEREEPERERPETITSEARQRMGTTASTLPTDVDELQGRASTAKTDASDV